MRYCFEIVRMSRRVPDLGMNAYGHHHHAVCVLCLACQQTMRRFSHHLSLRFCRPCTSPWSCSQGSTRILGFGFLQTSDCVCCEFGRKDGIWRGQAIRGDKEIDIHGVPRTCWGEISERDEGCGALSPFAVCKRW